MLLLRLLLLLALAQGTTGVIKLLDDLFDIQKRGRSCGNGIEWVVVKAIALKVDIDGLCYCFMSETDDTMHALFIAIIFEIEY